MFKVCGTNQLTGYRLDEYSSMMKRWLIGSCIVVAAITVLIERIYNSSSVVPITNASKIVSVSFEAIQPSFIRSERLLLQQETILALIKELPNGRSYPVSDGPGFEECEWIDLWIVNKNGSARMVRCGFEMGSCTMSIPVFCDRWEAIIGNIRHIHVIVSPTDCALINSAIVSVINKSRR